MRQKAARHSHIFSYSPIKSRHLSCRTLATPEYNGGEPYAAMSAKKIHYFAKKAL